MSGWIDGKWLLNFFVEFPDDYTLTIGNLRAVINDAPTIEVSEDAISREWLLSNIEQGEKEYGGIIDTDTDNIKNFISVAPNVIPKAKEGGCPYFIDGVWCNLVGKEMKGAGDEVRLLW